VRICKVSGVFLVQKAMSRQEGQRNLQYLYAVAAACAQAAPMLSSQLLKHTYTAQVLLLLRNRPTLPMSLVT
jgi:hypothetical protein